MKFIFSQGRIYGDNSFMKRGNHEALLTHSANFMKILQQLIDTIVDPFYAVELFLPIRITN